MKRSIVGALLGMMILACGVFAITAFGQAWEKSKNEPVTALEVLEKTVDDVLTEKMPIQVYPPGYFEWLLEMGDTPMVEERQDRGFATAKSSTLTLRSQSDVSSMQEQRLFNPATQKYQIVDLGTLGGNHSAALGINNKGQVVGYTSTNHVLNRPFLWSDGIMSGLQTATGASSMAYDINDSGQIVGHTRTNSGNNRASLWFNGSIQDLGTLGGTSSEAYGINKNGQVVGSAQISSGHNRAFLWSNGSMQNLGTLGGNSSTAYGINNHGHIVGSAVTSSSYQHAFLWSGSSMLDLGTVGGNYSWAYAINNAGQIVGMSHTNNLAWNDAHSFFYSGGSMHYIGTGAYGTAHGINESGQVVGFNLISGINSTAFLWSNGSLYDLNNLVDTNLSPQFTLDSANDINDKGQVVGYGRNSSGQTRAFLLNPVPEGWEIITNQPVRLIYGNLPVKQSGKSNLIVVTHGWDPDMVWLRAMTNSIRQYLTNNNLTTWQVAAYEWVDRATIPLLKGGFETALQNGKQDGDKLGKHIASSGWTHVHFIAHSAGSGLINVASEVLRTNQTPITIHTTFLDPYTGFTDAEKEEYGKYSDWADNYFSSGDYPRTESILPHAYNVDVTLLNKVAIRDTFISSGSNVDEPCLKSVSSHGWPHDFYQNTITGAVTFQYYGFGFPRGKEGGGWANSLINYANGSTNLGTPDDVCITFASANSGLESRINVGTASSYQRGNIFRYPNGLKATTQSPSWISMVVNLTNAVNFVSFDMKFASTNSQAQGLLSVYWDSDPIGSVDEQAVLPGFRRYTYALPYAGAHTTHMLGFRLDPFTNIQSVAIVTNVVVGVSGPSEPFGLSVTTNMVGNLKVLELTGPSNFNYAVEMSTNLINWETFAWLVNTNGSVRFYDQGATNFSQRYYRAVVPNSSF